MKGAAVVNGDAANIPLRDESVDLIITSPPYFALRSYQDEGEHYTGQIGSEPTPWAFLDALWTVTGELKRVLKPSGSIFVNLGDKMSGAGGPGGDYDPGGKKANQPRYDAAEYWQRMSPNNNGVPLKSLMGLPWAYALGCTGALRELGGRDLGLDLILRAEVIWDKPNGLPESVRDRVRRSHEQVFHFTKNRTYYSAVDELREPYSTDDREPDEGRELPLNPLGKAPGSVWTISTKGLRIPEAAREAHDLPAHFAAFPDELPRRIITGWSPNGICLECSAGRWPVVERQRQVDFGHVDQHRGPGATENNPTANEKAGAFGRWMGGGARILGYACECTPYTQHERSDQKSGLPYYKAIAEGRYGSADHGGRLAFRPKTGAWREYHLDGWTAPPSRPAVVLDPFGGTGTTAMVARALGRVGISLDMSAAYCRLARWRVFYSGHGRKAREREEEKTVLTFF